MLRGAILSQGGAAAPPTDTGTRWQLDASRRPAGLTLSNDDQTAINTSGGANYLRWVPTAKAIQPTDGRRYWEVLCAPGGAAAFDGYLGVVPAAQREDYNSGTNPIFLGAIGYRGNGTLWSSDTATAAQQMTGLPPFGAGDVVMFTFDPAAARLWIGRNGIWRDDPVTGAATWTAAPAAAFYPQIQGRNPGDGGTLRSLPSQFSYPVPPGVQALGFEEPDLRVFEAGSFLEFGQNRHISIAAAAVWIDRGGGRDATLTQATLYIEVELS